MELVTGSVMYIRHIFPRYVSCNHECWLWRLMAVFISTGCCFIEECMVKKRKTSNRIWCLLIWIAKKKVPWPLIYYLGVCLQKGKLLIKSSASYISTAWISPQEDVFKIKKVVVVGNYCHAPLVLTVREMTQSIFTHMAPRLVSKCQVWTYSAERHFSSVMWCRSNCHIF